MSDTPKDVFGNEIVIGDRVFYPAFVAGKTAKRFGTVVRSTDFGLYVQEEFPSERPKTSEPWVGAVSTRFMAVDLEARKQTTLQQNQ